ncbi:hypothetical protein [Nonomuraea sediminis]|uniref:hypothetical protein n=1 Tax=Nonomuraea sediminis TaxID=2835864 RepID=UPI001BDD6EC2|nr:hypothetical protein [Nonomuraea sediminis]
MKRADVHVQYNQILVGEPGAAHPNRVPNGLTAAAPGAAVILTGIHTGTVDVTVHLTDSAPPDARDGWDEVQEVELITLTGETRLSGLMSSPPDALPNLTPQGPGRYGMRVHARGRDIDPTAVPRVPFEFYLVTVWPIDVGPDAAGRLGVGVAEALGLPGKTTGIRQDPADEPGRAERQLREPWLLPQTLRGTVEVADHRFRIVNPFQDTAESPPLPQDLVSALPDSLLVRTLGKGGRVGIWISWVAGPTEVPTSWESFQEIEFVTRTGVMHVEGLITTDQERPNVTPQGAGRYGLRVHGRKRRNPAGNAPRESYRLEVWPVSLGFTG